MESITNAFLNDILKATATSDEVSYYQNVILAELAAAFKRHDDFKAKILGRLSVPKNQPTIKDAFAKCQQGTKCERDAVMKKLDDQDVVIKKFMNCMVDTMDLVEKKLTDHDAVLKDCVHLNKHTSDKIDYFMKIKTVDDVAPMTPLESAHQKAYEMTHNTNNIKITVSEIEDAHAEETPTGADAVEEAPDSEEVEETTAEQAPDGEEAVEETTGEDVEGTTEEAVEDTTEEAVEETTEEAVEDTTEEAVEETTEDVEEVEEAVEETTEEVEEVEETAEQAPDGEDVDEETVEEVEETTGSDAADVSEEEIDADEQEEEVEEYTHKGKKYYVTNTTNGKIYACTADDDIGDQVGSFKNGKPIFS